MTQWPEPEPEPGETARRVRIGAIAAGAAFLAWVLLQSGQPNAFSWRMPDIRLPEISMPDIDLRGRDTAPVDTPEAAERAEASESIAESIAPFAASDGSPVVQSIPFETCSSMLNDFASSAGQAFVVEDSAARRVRRYKFLEGNLTVTCSRADNTMTLEQGS